MSHTYKTNPYLVKLSNPEKHRVILKEVHDHRFGECNLPENPLNQTSWRGCYYTWSWNGRNSFCGCHLCTDYEYRIIHNRSERRKSKSRCKQFVVDPEYFDDMIDWYNKNDLW